MSIFFVDEDVPHDYVRPTAENLQVGAKVADYFGNRAEVVDLPGDLVRLRTRGGLTKTLSRHEVERTYHVVKEQQ
jgi:hypothetical protein